MDVRFFTRSSLLIACIIALSSCDSDESNTSRVSIGRGDTLLVLTEQQYQKPIAIQLSREDGAPQANTSVNVKLKTIEYNKGFYSFSNDINGDGNADQWSINVSATCAKEDVNENGILDAGEDTNLNGILDPKSPTVTQHPNDIPTLTAGTSSLITDDNGFGYFTITYPKSEAGWVKIELTVTAQDGLPENVGKDTFWLPVLISDISDPANDPPGGIIGPYGTANACTDTD